MGRKSWWAGLLALAILVGCQAPTPVATGTENQRAFWAKVVEMHEKRQGIFGMIENSEVPTQVVRRIHPRLVAEFQLVDNSLEITCNDEPACIPVAIELLKVQPKIAGLVVKGLREPRHSDPRQLSLIEDVRSKLIRAEYIATPVGDKFDLTVIGDVWSDEGKKMAEELVRYTMGEYGRFAKIGKLSFVSRANSDARGKPLFDLSREIRPPKVPLGPER